MSCLTISFLSFAETMLSDKQNEATKYFPSLNDEEMGKYLWVEDHSIQSLTDQYISMSHLLVFVNLGKHTIHILLAWVMQFVLNYATILSG